MESGAGRFVAKKFACQIADPARGEVRQYAMQVQKAMPSSAPAPGSIQLLMAADACEISMPIPQQMGKKYATALSPEKSVSRI